MQNKKVKILIVDDHKMFLEGIQSILADIPSIDILAAIPNGKEVLKMLNFVTPHIVITDIDMPEIDGITLTKMIKKHASEIKIIAVSSHSRAEIISKAITAGVNGYILKNTGKSELVKAIETVSKGEHYFSQDVKNNLNNSIFNPKLVANEAVKLSRREIEILTLISQEKNTQEIAKLLYISINTVETHRKNLMRKVGTKNMVGLVKYAIKQGII